jgi:hypothetical protein
MLMPDIEAGYRAKVDMLRACFGGGKKSKPGAEGEPAMQPATPQNVLAVFKSLKGR